VAKRKRSKNYTDEDINKLADELLKWFKADDTRLWLKDFAIEKNFSSDYLVRFADKNEKFSSSLKKAKDIQESRLVAKGFEKGSNTAFVIFTLKNVAKWRDKQPDEEDDNETVIKIKLPKEFAD
jgi:hypothetical protein